MSNIPIRGKRMNPGLKIGAALLIAAGILSPHCNRNDYDVTIGVKTEMAHTEHMDDVVYALLPDGSGRIFECADSFLEGVNGEDICSKIEERKRYKLKTYGFDIPYIGNHKVIVDVNEVK